MYNADERVVLLENTTRTILEYFELDRVKVINADDQGAGFYAEVPMTDSLHGKLLGLIGKGFSGVYSDDFIIYSKYVQDLGNTNIKFNKRNSRLTVAINV